MQYLTVATLLLATASASVLQPRQWNDWKGKETVTVYVTQEKPVPQIEYKTEYKTDYKTVTATTTEYKEKVVPTTIYKTEYKTATVTDYKEKIVPTTVTDYKTSYITAAPQKEYITVYVTKEAGKTWGDWH
ncbi:hypothetical protein B0A52_02574 [Exophiala mesophila]|uniref:Uncharacterized protein n=1 Tax=Exophiala mesophila TaxID=212818 RepID=A0A438ND13_EXOME|nr:hypothetical protein B0A52_02574 [Exophiala mesophila]